MSWVERLVGADDGTPRSGRVAGLLGVALGISVFGGPAFLLGARHAGAGWLIVWAMLWSPAFCVGPDDRGRDGMRPAVRLLLALGVVAAINAAILFAPYLAGEMLLPG